MTDNNKKIWKDYFLSSGVPLEFSVINTLKKFDLITPTEYKYMRLNESGCPSQFSVDIYTSYIDVSRNLWLEALLECKYRHDGIKWIFTPTEEDIIMPRCEDLYVTLDQYDTKRKFNKAAIASFASEYPLCGKGIELVKDSANPKSIEQAVQQLQYSVSSKAVDSIIHQVDELLGTPTPMFAIIPIIVTTAEIWRVKNNISLEDIRTATKIEDVAETHDAIICYHAPDNLLKLHTEKLFNEGLDSVQQKRFEKTYRRHSGGSYKDFIYILSNHCPSMFVVVHYNHLEKYMEKLLALIKTENILLRRKKKTGKS